jgi:hypothetical protein
MSVSKIVSHRATSASDGHYPRDRTDHDPSFRFVPTPQGEGELVDPQHLPAGGLPDGNRGHLLPFASDGVIGHSEAARDIIKAAASRRTIADESLVGMTTGRSVCSLTAKMSC